MKTTAICLSLLACLAGCTSGRQVKQVDPYVLKNDDVWKATILDPYKWSIVQLTEAAPISGDALCHARADIDADGTEELFIRADIPSRMWVILVFSEADGGYTYLGNFVGNSALTIPGAPGKLEVYEPSGGHTAIIRHYLSDNGRFTRVHSEQISCGDGAPAVNNARVIGIAKYSIMQWTTVPSQPLQGEH